MNNVDDGRSRMMTKGLQDTDNGITETGYGMKTTGDGHKPTRDGMTTTKKRVGDNDDGKT